MTMDVIGPAPILGSRIRDKVTGIEGIFAAFTEYYDRSQECGLSREGVDNDGHPWPLLWISVSRSEAI